MYNASLLCLNLPLKNSGEMGRPASSRTRLRAMVGTISGRSKMQIPPVSNGL